MEKKEYLGEIHKIIRTIFQNLADIYEGYTQKKTILEIYLVLGYISSVIIVSIPLIIFLRLKNSLDLNNFVFLVLIYPVTTFFIIVNYDSWPSVSLFSEDILFLLLQTFFTGLGLIWIIYIFLLGLEYHNIRKDQFSNTMRGVIQTYDKISLYRLSEITGVKQKFLDKWLLDLPRGYPIKREKRSIVINRKKLTDEILDDIENRLKSLK